MDSLATTQTSTLFNLQDIHIEISSKCTLKCPRCPRTELKPEELNREISLVEFQHSFTPNFLKLRVNKLIFCGDIGDPIYATEFLDIIKYIKSVSTVSVLIITNGSYRKPEWWQELGSVLTHRDQVTFSVDGWDQETNEQYRVNSNFDSIVAGARALRDSSQVIMGWSFIYFRFNNKPEKIIELATDLGFDHVDFVKSSKFDGRYLVNGIDELKPADANNIAKTAQYEKTRSVLKCLSELNFSWRKNNHPWARCLNHEKELFISVDGLVFPCPWFNSGYQENDFVKKYRNRLSIKTRTLEEILADECWQEFLTRLEVMPLDICNIKCRQCQ